MLLSSHCIRPDDTGYRTLCKIITVLLGFVTLPLWASDNNPSFHTHSPIANIQECRFLSVDGEGTEPRRELTSSEQGLLFDLLKRTRVGQMVASELQKFARDGIGGDPRRRLRLYQIERDMGPSAEYFESGELRMKSSFIRYLNDGDEQSRHDLYTAASFVVHEAIHAIAQHLFIKGEFAQYQPNTKVNEALAYFVQGLFLDEIRKQDPSYQETRAIPVWDRCTARIVRLLKQYGIDANTSYEMAYDLLAELQLEADEQNALRLSRLWQYFQFLHESEERDLLWLMDEGRLPRIKVVESVTDMIWLDVERRNCDFDNTFSMMKNRIILYANYADKPYDTTSCDYFKGFVQALRSEGEVSQLLRDEIDEWLQRRQEAAARRGESQ